MKSTIQFTTYHVADIIWDVDTQKEQIDIDDLPAFVEVLVLKDSKTTSETRVHIYEYLYTSYLIEPKTFTFEPIKNTCVWTTQRFVKESLSVTIRIVL